MTELPKILVVDNGRRDCDSALSTELAEMGYASVTAPFEAADEVLAMMPRPVAIVLADVAPERPRRAGALHGPCEAPSPGHEGERHAGHRDGRSGRCRHNPAKII